MAHRLSQILVILTFLLLLAGGLVTSTDSGLAVPDWPLSYGGLFPPMVGGIRFEHTHRLIAATVGFLTLVLTIWVGGSEKQKHVRWLAIASLGAVVLQGILGGFTVLFKLPPPVSILHACVGPIFFCLLVALAEYLRAGTPSIRAGTPSTCGFAAVLPSVAPAEPVLRCRSTRFSPNPALPEGVPILALFVFFQILLGAVVRHTGQGVLAHVVSAFVVLILTGRLVARTLGQFGEEKEFARPVLFLGFLVTVEFFLGIGAFAFTRISGIGSGAGAVIFPTLHQVLGSVILATTVVLTLRLSPSPSLPVFLELTKPRLVLLVLWTVTVGFLLGSEGSLEAGLLFKTLAGAALVAAGSMVLNQYLERASDARMKRTEARPLASGRMKPKVALSFGIFLSLAGLLVLALKVNLLSAALSGLTLASYLFLYTPLKSKTSLCTLAGALPGALPPVLGWAAARGELGLEAWILFSILFAWQLPHFFAIAWIYREDYARAGFRMLSVVDPSGVRLGRQIMLYTLALYLLSFLPAIVGMTGPFYYLGALLLGIGLIVASFRTAFQLDRSSRSFFKSSVLYLAFLFLFMILDKRPT